MRVIYEPKGKAGEYAELATNPYRGCGHGCTYCYVPLITKQPRPEFAAGAVPRKGYLDKLRKDAAELSGTYKQVMLCFTTDAYHPGDTEYTRKALEILSEHEIPFCVLTKGGTRSLRDIDLYHPDRDAYAVTLTAVDDSLAKWEPNAASAEDRIEALRRFHDNCIYTWVSLEPTLSIEHSIEVIRRTHPFVSRYKVGKANYLGKAIDIDWCEYTLRVIDVLNQVGADHYIKRDLQGYLISGYDNIMHKPQNSGAVSNLDYTKQAYY